MMAAACRTHLWVMTVCLGVIVAGTGLPSMAMAEGCGDNEPQKAEWQVKDAEGNPLYHVVFTGRGAAPACFELSSEQFMIKEEPQADSNRLGQVRQSAPWLANPGPKALVTTWKTGFLPFQLSFSRFGEDTRVERVLADPAAVTNPATGKAFQAGERAAGRIKDLYELDPIYTLVYQDEQTVTYVWPNPEQDKSDIFIEKTFTRSKDYQIKLSVNIYNFGATSVQVQPQVDIWDWQLEQPKTGMFAPQPDNHEGLCGYGGDLERANGAQLAEKFSDPEEKDKSIDFGDISWTGAGSRYFLKAVVPDARAFPKARCNISSHDGYLINARLYAGEPVTLYPPEGGVSPCLPDWFRKAEQGVPRCSKAAADFGLTSFEELVEKVMDGQSETLDANAMKEHAGLVKQITQNKGLLRLEARLFIGPKDIEMLKAMEAGVEDSIDFWIVGIISKPMLWLLRWFHSLIPSWVVAIILLTIVVKIITFWPTQKSYVAMQKMAALKPLMDDLKKKYENDKERLNQEMLAMYKREKVNPAGGCLPVLLQMPVWIALYRTIYSSVDLFQQPIGLWLHDMTKPDPYYIMPVVMAATMFFQQKITPTTVDSAQAKVMLYAMPIMFGVFSLFLPSGLNFYILINTVLSILQQQYIRKKYGTAATGR